MEDYYINLIHKKLSGSLSSEEESELTEWVNSAEENNTIYKQIELGWNTAQPLDLPKLNLDDEFSDLLEKRDQNETPIIPLTRASTSKKSRWMSIAAVLLVAIGLTAYFTWNAQSQEEWLTAQTTNETEVVQLADGTTVTLNANSKLEYTKSFNGPERYVKLNGEAFFDVAKNASKPFVIGTWKNKITVLGTSFVVNDFENDNSSYVLVKTGKVQFTNIEAKKSVYLTKGDKASCSKGENEILQTKNQSLNQLSWATKEINFSNTSLKDVIRDVSANFDINIELENEALENCKFTSSFSNETLDLPIILETIQVVLGVEIEEVSANQYKITGGGC